MEIKTNFRYDSRYNSEHKQHFQETIDYILEQEYGSTIPFEKLGQLMHYNLENEEEFKKFKSQMCRVKNFLIDYGFVLKSIAHIGYYILKPKQISGYCYHTYIRKTTDLIEKSDKILQHVDKDELSDIRKQEHKEVIELNSNVKNSIDTTIDDSKYFKNKEMYNNLDD